MRAWFESLEPRERLIVSLGAVVVAIALFYAFVWAPLDKSHRERTADVETWQRALTELRPLRGMRGGPAGNARPGPAANQQTPVVIVSQTLRSRGLERSLRRSQPTTGNGIRVEFENVAFDELVLWLGDLSAQFAMDVASGTVSVPGRGEPGRVNATLMLERAL